MMVGFALFVISSPLACRAVALSLPKGRRRRERIKERGDSDCVSQAVPELFSYPCNLILVFRLFYKDFYLSVPLPQPLPHVEGRC
jgi:hypothetical protein